MVQRRIELISFLNTPLYQTIRITNLECTQTITKSYRSTAELIAAYWRWVPLESTPKKDGSNSSCMDLLTTKAQDLSIHNFSDLAKAIIWSLSASRFASFALSWNMSASASLSLTIFSSSSICSFFLCFSSFNSAASLALSSTSRSNASMSIRAFLYLLFFSSATISIFLIASCTTSAMRVQASCGAISRPPSPFSMLLGESNSSSTRNKKKSRMSSFFHMNRIFTLPEKLPPSGVLTSTKYSTNIVEFPCQSIQVHSWQMNPCKFFHHEWHNPCESNESTDRNQSNDSFCKMKISSLCCEPPLPSRITRSPVFNSSRNSLGNRCIFSEIKSTLSLAISLRDILSALEKR
uniref:Uncharacterized protein n=1 Tax=Cucumis melo TaxID=3656 RepID=A0A9I9EKE7_CUCME